MIRQIPRGFIIAQLDGQPSGITGEPVEREFKNSKEIINGDIRRVQFWTVRFFHRKLLSFLTKQRIALLLHH